MSNEKDIWLSNCCGAEAIDPCMIDAGICPDCHEHCEFEIDEEIEVDEENG